MLDNNQQSFKAYAVQQLQKLKDLPDHFDFEETEEAFDLSQEFQRSEFQSEFQRLLTDEDLNFVNVSQNSVRRVSRLVFTPIRSMVNDREQEDLLADVPFPDIEEATNLAQASFSVEVAKDQASYAKNSVKLFQYAERLYFTFLSTMSERFDDFESIQPYPYPLQKLTFLMFLYWCKVTKEYSFTTISSTLCYGLLSYLHITKKSPDFRKNQREDIQAMLRSILRKFGHNTFKVEPLLNPDWIKLRNKCNLLTEEGSRLNALLAVSRARGLRGASLHAMKLRHLSWHKTFVNDRVCITLTMKVIKEKRLVDQFWDQCLPGFLNLKKCPNVALLIYLADCRGVFQAGSAAQCIISGNFALKRDMGERPVFCMIGQEFDPMDNKAMSNAMKNHSREVLDKTISTRSCRSGLVVSTLLIDTIRNNGMHDERTLQTLIRFVGWKSIEYLKPYDRWVTNHFTAINHFQEGEEGGYAMAVVVSLATDKGYLCGDELSEVSVANVHTTDIQEMNRLIKTELKSKKWFPLVRRLSPPKQMKQHIRLSNQPLDKSMTKEVQDLSLGVASKNTGNAFSKVWTKMIRDNRFRVEAKFKEDPQYQDLVTQRQGEKNSKLKQTLYERIRNIEEGYSATHLVERYYEENMKTLLSLPKSEKEKNKVACDTTNLSYGNFRLMCNNLKRKREVQIQRAEEKYSKEKERLKVKFAHLQYESDSDGYI